MEFAEIQQRLNEIAEEFRKTRDNAEAGIKLIDRLMIDLAREMATRKEE